MKRIALTFAGLCWIGFGVGFGFFLVQYVAGGAGLQLIGFGPTSGSVLIGMVHVIGLFAASTLSLAIGIGLCVHGLVPRAKHINA